jgi:hypothetical protein
MSSRWLFGLTLACWLVPAATLGGVFWWQEMDSSDLAPMVGTFMIVGSFFTGGVCGVLAIRLGLLGAAAAIGALANVWLAFVTVSGLGNLG